MARQKSASRRLTDAELKQIYGDQAIISRVGKLNLIHLDYPSEEEIRKRIEDAKSGKLEDGDDDCPLCRAQREMGGEIVFSCHEWCPDCEKKETCKAYNPDLEKIEKELELDDSDPTRLGGPLDPNQILNPWERSYGDLTAVAFSAPREAAYLLAHIVGGHFPELRDDLKRLGAGKKEIAEFKEMAWDVPTMVIDYLQSNSDSGKRTRIGETIDRIAQFITAYEKQKPVEEKIPDLQKKLSMLKELLEKV